MITKDMALELRHGQVLWHSTMTNADDTPMRVRVNGKCKTWKREPERWRLPVKYGMKGCFYLSEGNGHEWSLPDRWEVEKHWQQPFPFVRVGLPHMGACGQ